MFGMGTGVTPPLWPPKISCQLRAAIRKPDQRRLEDFIASTNDFVCLEHFVYKPKPSAD